MYIILGIVAGRSLDLRTQLSNGALPRTGAVNTGDSTMLHENQTLLSLVAPLAFYFQTASFFLIARHAQ